MIKALFSLVLMSCTLSSSASESVRDAFGLSPYWDWKTIETKHFALHFDDPNAAIAKRYAGHLEEAHAVLSPLMQWIPRAKTQVLILDNSDIANGVTSAYERFGIVLYSAPPDTYSSIAYYDDWMRMLALHEYAHFLNADPTEGWTEWLRWIFGDRIRPNGLWPSWMLEGLAVHVETRYTRSGRGKSPLYEGILRQAERSKRLDDPYWFTIDRINGEVPYFPAGEAPYLFGYGLMASIADRYGDATLGELSIASASRVPFLIDDNLERRTNGKNFYDAWDDWISSARTRMRSQLTQLEAIGFTPLERIEDAALSRLGNQISPDGRWMAFVRETVDKRTSLWLRDLSTGSETHVEDKIYGGGHAFSPDSRYLIYSGVRQRRQFRQFSDLSVYDLRERRITRLEGTDRFKDPTVSPDGEWVAYTVTHTGTTSLGLARMDWERLALVDAAEVYSPGDYARVAMPRFYPEGALIAFSQHRNGEIQEDLLAYDVAASRVSTIASNGARNRFPTFNRSGEACWISDLTGIDNLWCADANGNARMWTNVVGGLWFPEFAPGSNDVYASSLTLEGWELVRFRLPVKPYSANALIVSPPPPSILSAAVPLSRAALVPAPAPESNAVAKDYSPWKTLAPRSWNPVARIGEETQYFGAEVRGYDATDRHAYRLLGAYDFNLRLLEWLATYWNRSFGPTLAFEHKVETVGLFLKEDNGTGAVLLHRSEIEVSFPFRWTWSTLIPRLSLMQDRFTYDGILPDARFLSVEGGLYSTNIEVSRLAISAEAGRAAEIAVRRYVDGSHETRALANYTEYLRITEHAILAPRVSAMVSDQETRVVSGRRFRILDSIHEPYVNDLDGLSLRGYPNRSFFSRAAAVGSVEFRFPLLRPFRGLGTMPAFFNQVYALVFAETAWFPRSATWLPSAGAALRLFWTALLRVPLTFSLEYHQGMQAQSGGRGEAFGMLYFGELRF